MKSLLTILLMLLVLPAAAEEAVLLGTIGEEQVTLAEAQAALSLRPVAEQEFIVSDSRARAAFLTNYLEGRQALAEARALGIDREPAVVELQRQVLLEEFNRRLRESVPPPTDTEVREYYAAHPGEFTRQAGVVMQYIIAADTAAANRVRREWRTARDGARLHARYGRTPDSQAAVPYASLRDDLREPLRQARVNSVLAPVATDSGVMVIRKTGEVTEHCYPLDEVRDRVAQLAYLEKTQQFVAAYRVVLQQRHPLQQAAEDRQY